MSEQDKAMQNVFKKLGALRVTLPKDERDILDEVVQGSYSEVEGHVIKVASLDREYDFRTDDDEGEVEAHRLVQEWGAEKHMQKQVQRQTFRVAFDEDEKEVYKVATV